MGARRPFEDANEPADQSDTEEFDVASHTVLDPGPTRIAVAALDPTDEPTRQSSDIIAALAAREQAIDRDRRRRSQPVVMVENILRRTIDPLDELSAAGALARQDLRGSTEEFALAPRSGALTTPPADDVPLAAPPSRWRLPLLLLALALTAAAAYFLRL
jgi:hypothetical protein